MDSSIKIKQDGHGGRRKGAGRPKKGGKTKSIRIPVEIGEDVKLLAKHKNSDLPLYNMEIQDGVSSIASAEEFELYKLNHELVIMDSKGHFLVKVSGEHFEGSGILHDDILLVNRDKELSNGNMVIVSNDNKAVIKKFVKEGDKIRLISDNCNCVDLTFEKDLPRSKIWGVVTKVIRNL